MNIESKISGIILGAIAIGLILIPIWGVDTIILNTGSSSGTFNDTTVCANLGTGVPLHKVGSNCDAFSLIAGNDITITNTTNDYTIASTATEESTVCGNVGSGIIIHVTGSNCNAKSLIDNDNGFITSNSTNIIFNTTIWREIGSVYLSLAKTNIGTVYNKIYTDAFSEERMIILPCSFFENDTSEILIVFLWDYVGSGVQSLRWIDPDNLKILGEKTGITGDQNHSTIAVSVKSYCDQNPGLNLEWQGKSTVAGDDPVAKGYKIMVR